MELMDLPLELFQAILRDVALSMGIVSTVKLRYVNRVWDKEILHAVFSNPEIEMDVEQGSPLEHMDSRLLGVFVFERIRIAPRHQCGLFEFIREMASFLLDHQRHYPSVQAHQDYISTLCSLVSHSMIPWAVINTLKYADLSGVVRSESLNGPLVAAAQVGDLILVDKLLRDGRDVNFRSCYIGSPLRAAARQGHKDIVILLLKRGANLIEWEDSSDNALIAAASCGHLEIVKLFLQPELTVSRSGYQYECAIIKSAHYGQTEVLLFLMENWSFPDKAARNRHWGEALKRAAFRGYLSTVEMILKHGKLKDAEIRRGIPLMHAARRGHISVVQLLLKRPALAPRQAKETVLFLAARGGYEQLVRVLLVEHSMNVNVVWVNRWPWYDFSSTPLYVASERGHLGVVQLLLSHGADVKIDNCGNKALEVAKRNGHSMIVALLDQKQVHSRLRAEKKFGIRQL